MRLLSDLLPRPFTKNISPKQCVLFRDFLYNVFSCKLHNQNSPAARVLGIRAVDILGQPAFFENLPGRDHAMRIRAGRANR